MRSPNAAKAANYYGQEKEGKEKEGKEVAPLKRECPAFFAEHPLERKAVLRTMQDGFSYTNML